MEHSFNKKRFNMVMNITHVLAKIGKVLSLIVFAFSGLSVLVGLILVIFNFNLGTIEIAINEANIAASIGQNLTAFEVVILLKQVLIFGGLAGLATMAFFVYILHNLDNVLNNVKDNRPFVQANSTRLFNVAYSFMIASVVLPIFQFLLRYQIMIENPSVDINAEYTLYTGYLFVGLLLYILAHIFAYGSHLQMSYDETV